jgi:D-alanyl-D-alanine dipeptidase
LNNLVDLRVEIRSLKFDIKYATLDNFLNKVFYSSAKAYLVRQAAECLFKAQEDFNQLGLGILVWDAYRPLSVTKIFWDLTPTDKRSFVANPELTSVHNRGCAVDITLVDLATNIQLPMTSLFDEFNEKAKIKYVPNDMDQIKNRSLLIDVMQRNGFHVHADEWWHFNFNGYEEYSALDITIDELN